MSVHSVDTLAVHIPVLLLLLVTLLTTLHDYYYTICSYCHQQSTLYTGHCTCALKLLNSSASSGTEYSVHWTLRHAMQAPQLLPTSTESKHLSPAKQHTMDKSSGRGLPHNLSNCWTLDTVLRLPAMSLSKFPF